MPLDELDHLRLTLRLGALAERNFRRHLLLIGAGAVQCCTQPATGTLVLLGRRSVALLVVLQTVYELAIAAAPVSRFGRRAR